MDVPGGYHPEWGNPNTKEHTWYVLTDKWILAQKLRVLLRRGNKIPMKGATETKFGAETEGMTIQWLPHLGNPSHKQSPNPDTMADANKSLLAGAWYSCLLRGSASAWKIQKCMLTVIHWMEHRVPNEGVRECTQGAEEAWSPIGGTSIWTNQYPQSSLELNHQSKKTHGRTRGSNCICSRGWPHRSSMGGEILGSVKVICPSIGECQDQEARVGELVSRGGEEGKEGFWRGN